MEKVEKIINQKGFYFICTKVLYPDFVGPKGKFIIRLRASTLAESPLRSTGRGSVSFMGNGSPRTSQAGTLCGEWACRQTPFTAVCVSMKSVTVSPSRPLLDRLAKVKALQHRPSLRIGKLTAEKKKLSETLTKRFRELTVSVQFH